MKTFKKTRKKWGKKNKVRETSSACRMTKCTFMHDEQYAVNSKQIRVIRGFPAFKNLCIKERWKFKPDMFLSNGIFK